MNHEHSLMAAQSISWSAEQVADAARNAYQEIQRWAVLLRPKLYVDGNQWCALYGENIVEGVAGFGDSPSAALADFDVNMAKKWPENIKCG